MTSSVLERSSWTTPGSDSTAQKTYTSIKAALEPVRVDLSLDIYLQGSYANATNIHGDSDVDVVAQSDRGFRSNKARLSVQARQLYDSIYPAPTYHASELRRDIKRALVEYYGAWWVAEKDKCIKVEKRSGYVDADVVPAFQYRYFKSPNPSNIRWDWVEGIIIYPLSGGTIINYPKEHIRNGQAKNKACGGRYKSTVRQIKRLRNRAVAEGRIKKSESPGYLLECMTYNVPNTMFVSNDSDRLLKVVSHLKFTNKSGFISCDGIHTLFGTDPGKFSTSQAQRVADALWDAY
ncbi:MAG: nucleotidyltransferase [bacterium]|nr:nucleotidyltransferase [bacterium]